MDMEEERVEEQSGGDGEEKAGQEEHKIGDVGQEGFHRDDADQASSAGGALKGDGIAVGQDQTPTLSKNQLKKQQRQQRWAETKKERRKKEKEKIKEKKRKLLEEQRMLGLEEGSHFVKKTKMSDANASNIQVAIDCAYDDLMTEPDTRKLIKQIQRCYAENRKSAKPLQFYVSSLNGKTKQIFLDMIQGYQSWDVHLRAEGPKEAFTADKIVYLAAESPNVLQDLDPEKVYIIGGLVDHNHYKGYCYDRVRERGWNHAQLPIGEFVTLNSRKVLAVNHVYEIILAYVQLGSWKEAFNKILPNRKVKGYVGEDDPNPGSPDAPTLSDNPGGTVIQDVTSDSSSVRIPMTKDDIDDGGCDDDSEPAMATVYSQEAESDDLKRSNAPTREQTLESVGAHGDASSTECVECGDKQDITSR